MQFERRTEASAQARLLRPDCSDSGAQVSGNGQRVSGLMSPPKRDVSSERRLSTFFKLWNVFVELWG